MNTLCQKPRRIVWLRREEQREGDRARGVCVQAVVSVAPWNRPGGHRGVRVVESLWGRTLGWAKEAGGGEEGGRGDRRRRGASVFAERWGNR